MRPSPSRLLWAAPLLLLGCPEDPGTDPDPTPTPSIEDVVARGAEGFGIDILNPETPYTAKLVVTDAAGAAVDGAEVVIAGVAQAVSGTTVELTGLTVGAAVTALVRAPGHLPASVTIDHSRGDLGMEVVLQAVEKTQTLVAAAGGSVSLAGASVQFAANGFATEDGSAYAGEVEVAAWSMDLRRDVLNRDGTLRGVTQKEVPNFYLETSDESGNAAPSVPLGAIHVDLHGSGGQRLQPADGTPAQVEIKMSPQLAALYPDHYQVGAELPLSSRDDATGEWVTDGTCTVQQQGALWTCVGQAEHFSSLSITAPQPMGCLKVDEIQVVHHGERTLTARRHWIQGDTGAGSKYEPTVHYVNNDGALGLCSLVPTTSGNWTVQGLFQEGPAGTIPDGTVDITQPVIRGTDNLNDPVEGVLTGLTNAQLKTAAGCMQACAGVTGEVVDYKLLWTPDPQEASELSAPDGFLPPGSERPNPVGNQGGTDNDNDGYTALEDCDDEDEFTNPGADEICRDGIDNNCDGRVDEFAGQALWGDLSAVVGTIPAGTPIEVPVGGAGVTFVRDGGDSRYYLPPGTEDGFFVTPEADIVEWTGTLPYVDVLAPVVGSATWTFPGSAEAQFGPGWRWVLGIAGTGGGAAEGPLHITADSELTELGTYDVFGANTFPTLAGPDTVVGTAGPGPDGYLFVMLAPGASRLTLTYDDRGTGSDPHGSIVGAVSTSNCVGEILDRGTER